MKTILTSLLMAIAVFSMAAPTNNKSDKKANATTVKSDPKDGYTEQPKRALSPAEKKAKRERALIESKNEIWNSSNGGGRICYH